MSDIESAEKYCWTIAHALHVSRADAVIAINARDAAVRAAERERLALFLDEPSTIKNPYPEPSHEEYAFSCGVVACIEAIRALKDEP